MAKRKGRRDKRARVTRTRYAGHEHAVVTVQGGDSDYRTRPCKECPWRKDQAGTFPAEAFRLSANTAYDMSQHEFACHMAGAERPTTCAGFLRDGAAHNLSVRLKLARDQIDLDRVTDGGHELHASYRAMAEANGVLPTDPKLRQCRSNDG